MMVRTSNPANGMIRRDRGCGAVETSPGRPAIVAGRNPFGRLIAITRRNDSLLRRAEVLGERVGRARAYAAGHGSGRGLATATVEHAKALYADVLDELRGNRAEALEILRACGHRDLS